MINYNRYEELAWNKGYSISKDGIVTSPKGNTVGTRGKYAYLYFSFKLNGKSIKVYHHRFQAYKKFKDKIYEKDIVVRHLDGNSLNNKEENIEIGTSSDNMFDIPKDKRIKKSALANRIYSNELIKQIRKDKDSGLSYKDLMKKYNINSKGTLWYLVNKHLCDTI